MCREIESTLISHLSHCYLIHIDIYRNQKNDKTIHYYIYSVLLNLNKNIATTKSQQAVYE